MTATSAGVTVPSRSAVSETAERLKDFIMTSHEPPDPGATAALAAAALGGLPEPA